MISRLLAVAVVDNLLIEYIQQLRSAVSVNEPFPPTTDRIDPSEVAYGASVALALLLSFVIVTVTDRRRSLSSDR